MLGFRVEIARVALQSAHAGPVCMIDNVHIGLCEVSLQSYNSQCLSAEWDALQEVTSPFLCFISPYFTSCQALKLLLALRLPPDLTWVPLLLVVLTGVLLLPLWLLLVVEQIGVLLVAVVVVVGTLAEGLVMLLLLRLVVVALQTGWSLLVVVGLKRLPRRRPLHLLLLVDGMQRVGIPHRGVAGDLLYEVKGSVSEGVCM